MLVYREPQNIPHSPIVCMVRPGQARPDIEEKSSSNSNRNVKRANNEIVGLRIVCAQFLQCTFNSYVVTNNIIHSHKTIHIYHPTHHTESKVYLQCRVRSFPFALSL